MTNLIQHADELFAIIKTDFSDLWQLKHRQHTLEIVTPYTTLAGDAVSVFLTQREVGFVVSDGGRVEETAKEQDFSVDNAQLHCQEMEKKFGLKRITFDNDRPCLWYKITQDISRLSACIYDVAFFQTAVANELYMQMLDSVAESREKKKFDTRLQAVLTRKVQELSTENVKYEIFEDKTTKFLHFTTGIRKIGRNEAWLGMGIHRSNPNNFERSVALSSFGFESVGEHFPNWVLHKGAILDEWPGNLKTNNRMIWLQRKVEGWGSTYGVKLCGLNALVDMETMEYLFGNAVA